MHTHFQGRKDNLVLIIKNKLILVINLNSIVGLVVGRGTHLTLVTPTDGTVETENPFLQS